MKHLKQTLAGLALVSAATMASAASVRVSFDTPIFGHGYDANVTVKYQGRQVTAGAGAFSGTLSHFNGVDASAFVSVNDFVGYCYDLYETVSDGQRVSYTVNMSGETARTLDFLGAVNTKLNQERGGAYDPYAWLNPSNGAMSAAIQLGIWESLYETGATSSLSAGTFQATAGVDAGTLSWLNSFYAVLDNSAALDGKYVMTLTAAGAQDLLTGVRVAEVPEPASLSLIGLALAGLAAARRRRR